VHAYRQFQNAIHDFADVTILPFDDEAADEFQQLRGLRLMVGTMDLKIAGIARSHAALLLTRNLVDFSKVPGLLVENWLD
jgi:tRNA(fMet)-specific endonuclease VapC